MRRDLQTEMLRLLCLIGWWWQFQLRLRPCKVVRETYSAVDADDNSSHTYSFQEMQTSFLTGNPSIISDQNAILQYAAAATATA